MEGGYDKMLENRKIRLPPERGLIKAKIFQFVKKVANVKRTGGNKEGGYRS